MLEQAQPSEHRIQDESLIAAAGELPAEGLSLWVARTQTSPASAPRCRLINRQHDDAEP